MKQLLFSLLLLSFSSIHIPSIVHAEDGHPSVVKLRLIETTDLHGHIYGYDYKNLKEVYSYGFVRTATLIQRARYQSDNHLLFDVGDAIVGSPLAKYVHKSHPISIPDLHPVYHAMNALQYDAATLGNHEFNYGLNFLSSSLKSAKFPIVNANIVLEGDNNFPIDDIPFLNPYTIIEKKVVDTEGEIHSLKVGVIGLITPVTAIWDDEHFKGNLKIKNIQETAERLVPIIKSHGADIIVALVHVGLEPDKQLKEKEGNSVVDLSKVDGIDAILYGHSHKRFPDSIEEMEKDTDVNFVTGTINGVPAVQAGKWGNHIGIIDLALQKQDDKWLIVDYQSKLESIYKTVNDVTYPTVPMNKTILMEFQKLHQETIDAVKNGQIRLKK